jgi:Protein of unknown function (DUF2911)
MKILVYFLLPAVFFTACTGSEEKKAEPVKQTPETDSIKPVKPELPAVNPYVGVDVSPMDMSYYPVDYPKLKMAKKITTLPRARVVYSRPHLQGRHIFHEVLKYEEPWRLGANEATELDLFSDVTIQNKKIKAGRYIIYCIPHKDNWAIVINSNIDSWGLEQDRTKDVASFTVPVIKTNNSLEFFTMLFEKKETAVDLIMAWDNVEVRLPIVF